MANSIDFRADQVQTSKIIVTGSTPQKTLLIYGIDADGVPANQGNIKQTVFPSNTLVGGDVFLYVSGGQNQRQDANGSIAVFGGDVVFSGAFYQGQPATIKGGNYSHAEGGNTYATGDYSHAEGSGSAAPGDYSHAEGRSTFASGDYSHAEGINTLTSGDYSHAEGESTEAYGSGSHAEGYETYASGSYSHAEGRNTEARGKYSHAEGQDTVAIGNYSHAEGNTAIATGVYSHAEGVSTNASGDYSHTEGYQTTATGIYSHAEGYKTQAKGTGSLAAGLETIAYGPIDGAPPTTTQAAFGKYNIDNNIDSLFVVGDGLNSFVRHDVLRVNSGSVQVTGSFEVLGGITGSLSGTVGGLPFIVAGANITANYNSLGQWEITGSGGGGGTNFFTEIDSTNIFTTSSVALAKLSASLGAEITGSLTQGNAGNVASGQNSHAEGGSTTASGDNSHAEGFFTTASGQYSHAEGVNTKAFGTGSLAVGLGTIASGAVDGGAIQTTVQAAFGKYNLENNTDSLFVVGDGLNSSNRHDVLRVNSGSVEVTGSLEVLGGITGSLSGTVAGNPFIVAGSNITASYNSLGQWNISTTSPPAGLDGSLKIPSDASWTVVGTGTATATSGELNLSCASAFPSGAIAMLTTAPTSPHFYAIELLARIQSNSLSTGGSGYALSLGFTTSAQNRGYRIRLDQAGNISDRVNTAGTWNFTGSSYSPGLSWSTGTTWLRMIVTNGYIQLYYGTGVGTTIPTSWSLAHLVATPDTTLIRNGTLDRLELLLEHFNATTGTLDIDVFPFTRSLITNPT